MQPGILYLVPSPLGHADISLVTPQGVKRIVANLDTFIVENAKTARQYLARLELATPLQRIQLLILNEHTPPEELTTLLKPLLSGKNVGLMSEAGCPAVADPGAALVNLAHANRIRVVPLAGPSAVLLALMASGMNGQRFAFHGYLPVSSEERIKKIAELEKTSKTLDQTEIFIEAPYRNRKLLQSLLETCRETTLLCLATDITLVSESIATKRIGEWKSKLPQINRRPTVFLLYAG
ncbi:MAG TPA: SAM-dependent methyltransferase [Burkholderiales bacterium]|nr:SAM-dependent methyltransferase [Burkholderiales bacterium]